MIDIDVEEGDAEDFVRVVEGIARGICRTYRPPEIVIVRIDNWFDHKWLEFSGKVLGGVGTWNKQLRIPPFMPNRVCWQHRYRSGSSSSAYEITDPGPALHVKHGVRKGMVPKPKQRIPDKPIRLVSVIEPNTVLIWFSGKSEETGHGAVMAYFPLPDGYWTWYAGFIGNGSWQISHLRGVSRSELNLLMESADSALAAPEPSA